MNAVLEWLRQRLSPVEPGVPVTGRYAMPPAAVAWAPVARFTLIVGVVSTLCVLVARVAAAVAPALATRVLFILALSLAVAGVAKWMTRGAMKGVLTTTFAGIVGLALVTGTHGPINFMSLAVLVVVCYFVVSLVAAAEIDQKIDQLPAPVVFLLSGIALASLALAQPPQSAQLMLVLSVLAITVNGAFALCLAHTYAGYVLAQPDHPAAVIVIGRDQWRLGWGRLVATVVGSGVLAALGAALFLAWLKLVVGETKEDNDKVELVFAMLLNLVLGMVVLLVATAFDSGGRFWRMLSVWLVYDGEPRPYMFSPFIRSLAVRRAIFGCVIYASVLPVRAAFAFVDAVVVSRFGVIAEKTLDAPSGSFLMTLAAYAGSFVAPAALLLTAAWVVASPVHALEVAVPNALQDGEGTS